MSEEKFKPVTLEDIQKAKENIRGSAIVTPLKKSNYFSEVFKNGTGGVSRAFGKSNSAFSYNSVCKI